MKRTLFTLLTFGAVTAARAADLATTFHFNPSLSHEANPIVALWGGGAATLLLSNIVLVTVFLFVPLFFFWRYPARPLSFLPANTREYLCLQIYKRIFSPAELFRAILTGVPMPKDWIQVLRCMGIVLSWSVVFNTCLAVFSWWAIWEWHWKGYQKLRTALSIHGYPAIETFLSFLFFFLAGAAYFHIELSQLRKNVAPLESPS